MVRHAEFISAFWSFGNRQIGLVANKNYHREQQEKYTQSAQKFLYGLHISS
jgi:hypothetical protein